MLIKFVPPYFVIVLSYWTFYFNTDFASQMKLANLPLIHLKHLSIFEHKNSVMAFVKRIIFGNS